MRVRSKFFCIILCWIIACISSPVLAKKHHKLHFHQKKDQKYKTYQVTAYNTPQLAMKLNQLVNGSPPGTHLTLYVKSMKFGDTLYKYNINKPLVPASTLKILTAEAALLYLGADWRFATRIYTDAPRVKNGILQGNLYIVLNGDPSLTYQNLIELMMGLKKYHIEAIAGNVYLDNSAYDQNFYGPGWVWKDKNSCYGAPVSASIINRNCLPLQIAPSKMAGHLANIITSPKYFYPNIRNSVLTRSNTRTCVLHLTTHPNSTIVIDGCLSRYREAAGFSYVVTDIPEYNRVLFKNLLNQLGVNVYGRVAFATAPRHLSLVNTHYSKPLHLLINDMLKKSVNVIAGALFKKLGQLYTHQPGSWENGSIALSHILSKKAGVNSTGLRILDGSGVSPNNLTTATHMMQVLDFAYHHYATSYEFISALPIAGVDGTLKQRMQPIARKVRAKTGTISGVASLAGYAFSTDKEPLAFVIIINGSKGYAWKYRILEDEVATALTKYKRLS